MSIHKLSAGPEYRGIFIDWIEEWSQFFQACNWRTFHPIHFELEDDRHMGGVELSLIVLGLGFRVRWNYASTEKVEEIERSLAEIKEQLGID